MRCKTCGLWRAFLVLASVSAAVSFAQLVKDDSMMMIPAGMPSATDDVRPATEPHRRMRNATRPAGAPRRTAGLHHHQTVVGSAPALLDAPDDSEPAVARVKKKIKHKRTWDEPEAQASSEAQQSTATSKRPDRVKTRRRLVPAASSTSTARTLRTAVAAAAVLHEDPYYDFGKKISKPLITSTSTLPSSSTPGLNAVDLETRTSVRSPIVVATGSEEDVDGKSAADRNNSYGGAGRTRTQQQQPSRGQNSTSSVRRPENQAECAYPRYTRRNKTRLQRDARCLPEPAAADAARTTRILSTVVTSVSSVKGGSPQPLLRRSNDTLVAAAAAVDPVSAYATAADDRPTPAAAAGTASSVEHAASGYPKYLRNRYRNISLPEYLEITRVNQRRLNGSTGVPPAPSTTTEAARTPSPAEQVTRPSTAPAGVVDVSTSASTLDDGAADTVEVPTTTAATPTTTTTIASIAISSSSSMTSTDVGVADRLHHLHSPSPPTDLQDFIYLHNGTSETPSPSPPDDGAVEARHRRPSLLQPRNLTRPLEHDVAGVVYPDGLAASTYLLTFLAVVPLVLVIVFAFKLVVQRKKKKRVFDSSEYSSEYNRSPLDFNTVTSSPITTKLPRVPQHIVQWDADKQLSTVQQQQQQQQVPYPLGNSSNNNNSRWEFPRDKLRLQTILGQGNFGQVWKAEADDISGHEGLTRLVAVKMVKEDAASREREDLIRELSIMQHLGSHPNVVTLLGCCTEKEPYLLIMEYVMYGKLLAFLRDRRTRSHYFNFSDSTASLTSRDLTVFAYCVARGMDFLVSKKIVHRDLAARNVLVDHNKLCKIADFGMSRNVRDTNQIYEQRHTKGALPIRWMAPESLHYSIFTYKTDVWSFGVLMWEIVTLGSTPYCTMGAREVMRRVREGYRLDKPAHCRSELFRVITKCWAADPAKRPTFADLKQELGALLEDPEFEGSYVDLESLFDESDGGSGGGGAKDRHLQQQ